ncbi:MAG: 5'-nucleotidase, lipoprotein e(P4) family [Brumimicrobium sp.]|nr:5'-nucleotidase, lipoprotein e(P4) family [Brumimicrobium sp.]
MKYKFVSFILAFAILLSCSTTKNTVSQEEDAHIYNTREYSIQSVLWQQNAGEYRALCYQAFNLAQLRLDQFLADESLKGKKLAIITDIDETVMDNSPYNARLILDNKEYTAADWTDWVNHKTALAIPGATDFLNYAKNKGVEVFYISNRMEHEKEATLENMKQIQFPFADNEHLLFKTTESSKQVRFDKVLANYTVLLFMGDNLSDFSSEFIVNSTQKRNQIVDAIHLKFGYNFIVLPNPMYGDWESKGIYQGKYNWTTEQKDSIWKSNLKGY